jgi:cis-3-alkyl-4-acyloxetan-2-one decarboxylase
MIYVLFCYTFSTRLCNSMNTSLYVRSDSGQGPPIVLLHGIFADGTQWEKINNLLQKEYRVIVVDLLGHGRSPRPEDSTYSPAEHASALRKTLESLKATDNLTIVGYSMGGNVALSYAAKYPSGIDQLYLISAPFYLKPDEMIINNYASSVLVTKISQSFYNLVHSMLKEDRFLDKLVGYADRSNYFHKMIGANDNKLDSKIIKLNIKNMINQFDFASYLSKAVAPTTFYAGKKDPFIVQGQLTALTKFSPNIDIQRLDIIKIDHMLVQNLPKEIVGLITKNKMNLLNIKDDIGSNKPMVLLHGIESSASYWKPLIGELSEKRRVITIDLLGFGESPKPKNLAYSLNDHTEWLDRTINRLGITNFDIVGHSLGSLVALSYAASYPKKVKSLTMFSPVLIPEQAKSRKISVRLLQKTVFLPSFSYLYSQLSILLGSKKIAQFTPSIRSLENSINKQSSFMLAKKAANVPIGLYYGSLDPLVDSSFVHVIAGRFKTSQVVAIPKQAHNFPIFKPKIALNALIGPGEYENATPASAMPPSFLKQIIKLAAPTLLSKSLLLILTGLLLFTSYAGMVVTIGLAIAVIIQGYKIINGAFSLKNEGLSYIGYFLVGILTILIGYGLYNHPETSLKIAIYLICSIVALSGLIRILVAFKWTSSKAIKKSLLFSGIPMLVVGVAALMGSIFSIHLVVYTIAVLLIARGLLYGWYSFVSIIMAYIRGFNHW